MVLEQHVCEERVTGMDRKLVSTNEASSVYVIMQTSRSRSARGMCHQPLTASTPNCSRMPSSIGPVQITPA